jgi:hypothetical protein
VLAASITIAQMVEAVSTSKTSVNYYQTTRRNNPEDSHPHKDIVEFNGPSRFISTCVVVARN